MSEANTNQISQISIKTYNERSEFGLTHHGLRKLHPWKTIGAFYQTINKHGESK